MKSNPNPNSELKLDPNSPLAQHLANKPGPKPGFKRGSPSQATIEARKRALQPEERARRATLAQSLEQAKEARIEARRAATAQAAAARQQDHKAKAEARLHAKLEKQVKSGRYSSLQDALDAHNASLERSDIRHEMSKLSQREMLESLRKDALSAKERYQYLKEQYKSASALLGQDSDKEEFARVYELKLASEEARKTAAYRLSKYTKANKPETPPISGAIPQNQKS